MRTLLRSSAAALAASIALAGCAALETKQETIDQTNGSRVGPEQAPFRSITGFSSALRCMDSLMIDYGVRDVSTLVEELTDNTKKVNAGTRDMLITAVSDMTRRSRALRVVAFGKDATNAVSFLASAQRLSAYEVIPQYDIKGSVSQFDENVIRDQKDLGIGYQPYLNLGVARDNASSILGLDLSVLATRDMSVIAGVTSRNSVVILKSGNGFDADAAYHKFGVNFSMTLSKSEGQAQALRGLVELAVIELVGKLTKTPYWSCLGGDPNANEEIRQEMADWFFAMAATRVEIIAYFQNQLRRRGFYDGPIDGEFNPAIDEAVANYRAALGLSREPKIDQAFFEAFLTADHSRIPRPAQPARLGARPAPLMLLLAADNNRTYFKPGESFNLMVGLTRDAHVYCYLQDETARITRFFPNRFSRDSLVPAAKPLLLPGSMRFQLSMNPKGVKETIACFATERDVSTALPAQVIGTDFEPLAVKSIDQLRSAFANASGGALAEEKFNVQAK
ncbi:MAG TPA: DUF4384 domain-containing protein [Burkholderiales bacterium]|jgi:hypothetical protein|nr:DUF4384 domain-containing protein [Burkholderiales bacterium]